MIYKVHQSFINRILINRIPFLQYQFPVLYSTTPFKRMFDVLNESNNEIESISSALQNPIIMI